MTGYIRTADKKGSYTLEAVIFLPLIVLAVLSFGYFTKVEGIWENCIHCAADESCRTQAMAWDGTSEHLLGERIRSRINREERGPSSFALRAVRIDYSDGTDDHLDSFVLDAHVHMPMPAGFSRDFTFSVPFLFRGFTGKNMEGDPLGTEGLENGVPGDPAYIFPAYGKKYHQETCTYVKAGVHSERLGPAVRKKCRSCSICRSGELSDGNIVFCFESTGSAYHRGSCRTIDRHVIVIDRTEAQDKGYSPCSKCGGALPPSREGGKEDDG